MQLHRHTIYLLIPAVFSTALSWADETTSPIHSQPCFLAQSDVVELALTEKGGHLGPVTFYRNSGQPVRPYYTSPWQDENAGEMPVPVLVPLRGDFFCMPFGGNQETVDGETHPPHGEVAGSKWDRLQDVPMAWKDTPNADLSRLPGPQGFADLVQLVNELPVSPNQPAWTTATFPDDKYLWFSFKDPRILRTTVLWMENRGRHGFPWNGRNNCLGLEDVTAYFADGLLTSTQSNTLSQAGVPTSITLTASAPTTVNYIQGVVQLPDKFEQVESVEFTPGSVSFVSTIGQRVSVAVRHEFLFSGQL